MGSAGAGEHPLDRLARIERAHGATRERFADLDLRAVRDGDRLSSGLKAITVRRDAATRRFSSRPVVTSNTRRESSPGATI
jgi:hypothetical protein